MILLDSSAWLEIFTDGPLAGRFENYVSGNQNIIVSPVTIFEIYRKLAPRSEESALEAVSALQQLPVIPIDETLSLEAGHLAITHGLAMADSLILATTKLNGARLITKDNDFRNIPGCVVIA